jgi:hypothetical protein
MAPVGKYVRELVAEIERLRRELADVKRFVRDQRAVLIEAGALLDKDAVIDELRRELAEVRDSRQVTYNSLGAALERERQLRACVVAFDEWEGFRGDIGETIRRRAAMMAAREAIESRK